MSKTTTYLHKKVLQTFKLKEDHLKDIKYNSIKEWDSVGHMTMIGKLEEASISQWKWMIL